jgi:transmembrane sensor
MDIVKINELVAKLRSNQLSVSEEKELMNWLHHFNNGTENAFNDEELSAAQQEMWAAIRPAVSLPKERNLLLWGKWIGAAAAILLVTFAISFFSNNKPEPFYIAKDIPAGKNTATLTLANGKVIDLANATGAVAEETGVLISKTKEGQLVYEVKGATANSGGVNTLATINGQTFQVILPDGSKVWLNAASSLTYPSNFGLNKLREVALQGEAYFEVTEDHSHPFRVKSNLQTVEVLGTHFNVNSYANEHAVRTTLVEGSVRVKLENGVEKVIRPNEQAVLVRNSIQVSSVNIAEIIDWKDGKFVFNNEDIQSLMRKISRWYNVEVVYEGEITQERFGGNISRTQPISKILEALQLTGFVKFKAEGRRITVLSNN